jgi:uncharacterized delta-60 repeat protein
MLERRGNCLLSVLVLGAISLATTARSDPGDLDPTFGTGGVATPAIGTHAYANAVAVQADGKILAAGYVLDGSHGDMLVARFNDDGTLDGSFGTGGVVKIPAADQSIAQAIALQSDGKIVVGGGVVVNEELDYDFRVARLLPADGELDSTFGEDGIVETRAAATQPGINSLVVQPDGKILVGGEGKPDATASGRNRDFLVARYLGDGSPDTSFGNGGRATVDMGKRYDAARSLLLQPDGAIVAAGYAVQARSARAVVTRLTSGGGLDRSFAGNGRLRLRLGGKVSYGTDAQLLGDGRILIAGLFVEKGSPLFTAGIALAKLTSAGSRDTSFGNNGIVTAAPDPDAYYHPTRAALQSDGKVVVVGGVTNAAEPDFTSDVFLARFLADGTLDASFADGGIVRTAHSEQDALNGVALTAEKIVVVGQASISGQSRIHVRRYVR